MKKTTGNVYNWKIILTLPLIAAVISSCGNKADRGSGDVTQEEVKEEISEAAGTTKSYIAEEKQAVVEDFNDRLDKLEMKIANFKDQMSSVSASVKQSYQAQVDTLESRFTALEQKVNQFKSSSDQAWEDLKDGVEDALVELEDSVEDAKKEYSEET